MPRNPTRQIDFVGPARRVRRRLRAAVMALEGASTGDLARALAAAGRFDPDPLLIAVDGGLATCRRARRRPDLFVGDGDSAGVIPKRVPATIYPVAKSFSDFAGALGEARRVGAEVAVIAGLLGGRLDHEWANLLEAAAAAPTFAGILAPTPRGIVVVTAHGVRAHALGGRLVSLFALGGTARVSLRGARWTLTKHRLAPGSLGLSNIGGDRLALDVHAGVVALVLPTGGR